MHIFKLIGGGMLTVLLAACGGDSGPAGPLVLAAGATHIMAANETVLVPSGTTVTSANNNVVTLEGHMNTATVPAGSRVVVAADASGAADNKVITGP